MIILIYGPDSYRGRERLNELILEYQKKYPSGINLNRFETKDINWEVLENEMFGLSMFNEKKLIILDNFFENIKLKEVFSKNTIKFIKSDNILILYEGREINPKDKFLNFLKDQGAKLELFENLSGVKLKNWINKEAEKNKVRFTLGAVNELVNYIGNDLWRLENEIKRLAHFVLAESRTEISESDLQTLIIPDLELNIFEAIDALTQKNKSKAIRLLKEHLMGGAEVPYLFSMIAWQIKNIIIAKTANGNFQNTGISPYVLRKSIYQANNFSLDDLKNFYQKIIDLDADIKVGKILPETALDLLILEI